MLKNFIASTIVVLGIAGAYFVVQQNADFADRGGLRGKNQDESANNNNLVSREPFVENIPLGSRGSTPLDNFASNGASENLTDGLTEGIKNALSLYNPNGTIDMNGQQKIGVPDPEALSENLLAEAAQKFDPNSLKPAVAEKDLKISNDNSKESLRNYFNSFNRIINDSAAALSKETLSATEINPGQMEEFILMYNTAYKNLKIISVPSSLVKIHQQELELLGAKSAIYRALKNYEADPLLSILASENLEKFDQEFSNLDKEIAAFIKNNNL